MELGVEHGASIHPNGPTDKGDCTEPSSDLVHVASSMD